MKRAIVNSNLFDVQTGVVRENTTIIWEDKIIKEIGQNISIPSDAEVIDSTGYYVTPGLINSYTHIGLKEHGVRWEGEDAFEASGTIQSHLSVIDGIYPFDKNFKVARAAGVTTAHVSASPENVISGKTAIIKTNGTVVDEMIVQAEHGMSISFGEIPKKAHVQRFKKPLTRMRIASIIRDQLRKVQYKEEWNDEDVLINKILEKKVPMYIRAHRSDDIVTAIRLKKEFDINIILVHATDAKEIIDVLRESEIPVLLGPFYSSKSRAEVENLHPSTAATLNDAGIPFALATPSVRNLPLEGALTVREGLPAKDALYALTMGAAEILGISEQLGSLEVGKEADIVIWNGDPLELKSNVEQTIIGGSTVYNRGKDK